MSVMYLDEGDSEFRSRGPPREKSPLQVWQVSIIVAIPVVLQL